MFILRDLRAFNILIYLVMRSLKITMFTRERDVHYARNLFCIAKLVPAGSVPHPQSPVHADLHTPN